MDELEVLARTIFGEARGEGDAGRVGVANVILNRVKVAKAFHEKTEGKKLSHLFGVGTIISAAQRPWQFSCWNESDPNRKKILAVTAGDKAFAECIVVARLAIAGLIVDNTKGSTHYHTTAMGFPPSWRQPNQLKDPEPVVIIGKHSFYNNVK